MADGWVAELNAGLARGEAGTRLWVWEEFYRVCRVYRVMKG